ncbi:hypothetical protein PHLCEN_2v2826 [Hermanssonia centrifuga]|uniref:Uncharacterized protein n=1 Tax=Hermanssonia centrifuga TaxID=98765 RepID=A0A2R6RI60_9APHY|nr:hypothetical protein PHLCEN_2v2826 [Hermanssonia centrifuga]
MTERQLQRFVKEQEPTGSTRGERTGPATMKIRDTPSTAVSTSDETIPNRASLLMHLPPAPPLLGHTPDVPDTQLLHKPKE